MALRSSATDDSGNVEQPVRRSHRYRAVQNVSVQHLDECGDAGGGVEQRPERHRSRRAVPSDIAGYIKGIRFYKGSSNTGPHTGKLWTASGTLLASATFSGETASGWQEVRFATPVAITANTTYVASYYTAVGILLGDVSLFHLAGRQSAAPCAGERGRWWQWRVPVRDGVGSPRRRSTRRTTGSTSSSTTTAGSGRR